MVCYVTTDITNRIHLLVIIKLKINELNKPNKINVNIQQIKNS